MTFVISEEGQRPEQEVSEEAGRNEVDPGREQHFCTGPALEVKVRRRDALHGCLSGVM
jgi:hypothetical protein